MTQINNVMPTEPTPANMALGTVYAPTPTVLPTMMLMADITPSFPSSRWKADCGDDKPGVCGCRNHVWSVGDSSERRLASSLLP